MYCQYVVSYDDKTDFYCMTHSSVGLISLRGMASLFYWDWLRMFIWKLRENRAMTRDLKPLTYAYTHTHTHSQNTHAHRHTHTKSSWEKMRADSGKLRELQMNPDARSCKNFQCVPSVLTQRFGNEEALSLSNEINQTESRLKIASHAQTHDKSMVL